MGFVIKFVMRYQKATAFLVQIKMRRLDVDTDGPNKSFMRFMSSLWVSLDMPWYIVQWDSDKLHMNMTSFFSIILGVDRYIDMKPDKASVSLSISKYNILNGHLGSEWSSHAWGISAEKYLVAKRPAGTQAVRTMTNMCH